MTMGKMMVGTWKGKVVTGMTEPGKSAHRGRWGQEGEDSCAAIWFVEGEGQPSPSFIESFISSPCGEGGPDTHIRKTVAVTRWAYADVLKTYTNTHTPYSSDTCMHYLLFRDHHHQNHRCQSSLLYNTKSPERAFVVFFVAFILSPPPFFLPHVHRIP